MKRLTHKQKLRQLRRVRRISIRQGKAVRVYRNRTQNRVSMWYRGRFWNAKPTATGQVRRFPELMCFLREPELTLQAFEYIRRRLHANKTNRLWLKPKLNENKDVTVNGYTSMRSVKEISTSAALVLAAEYERKMKSMDESAPLFELEHWDKSLLNKLDQIGFLEKFGYHFPKTGDQSLYTDVMTVPFYSGTRSEMEKVDKKLLKLVEHIDPKFKIGADMLLALNSAVGEATTNTREHAYKDYHQFQYPHVGRWWATGAASASTRTIVVSLYDQGVTIPVSYPRLPFFQSIFGKLDLFDASERRLYVNDAKLIQAATVYGKSGRDSHSGSGNKNRVGGFGLPQIKDAINLCRGGALMILSRGGRYIYELTGGVQSEQLDTYDCSVGGTLIEWTVTLPEPR
jgi:hypothetical protein